QLAEQGIHANAIVSVEGGLTFASIATSLVLFSHEATADLFIARLDQNTPLRNLVDNLVGRRAAPIADLGAVVPAIGFRGWRSYVLEQELSRQFSTHEMRSLGDVGAVRVLALKPGQPYEAPANAVFVPTIGVGPVTTSPP